MKVALQVTCINDALFPGTGKAVVTLLRRLGVEVEFPTSQTCCGQPMVNTGYLDEAVPAVRAFVDAFASYDAIVTPSRFSAEEFERIGVHAHVIPLGVELDVFRPHLDPDTTWPPIPGATLQLLHCGRLSPEKRPALSIETVRELVRRGHDVQMTVEAPNYGTK